MVARAASGNRLEKVDKYEKEVYTYNVKNQLTGRKSQKAEICYRYAKQEMNADYSRTRIQNELEQYEQELTPGDCKEK